MTHAPSPSILTVTVDALGNLGSDERVDDIGQVDSAVDETTPLQGSNIGQKKRVHWMVSWLDDFREVSSGRPMITEYSQNVTPAFPTV